MRVRFLALALLLAAPTLAGCGFTPLYASPGVSSGLSTIETVAPQGRTGFLLGEALDDALVRDPSKPASWKLKIDLKEVRTPRGRLIDATSSRYELVLTADWQLVDATTGAVALQGETSTEVTFDRTDQPYAGIVANQDAQSRAASELARKIQLQVAVWMSRGAGR